MSLSLPLRADLEDFDEQLTLDGTVYTLRFRWNRRESFWFLDVSDEDGNPIRLSIKVVIDLPLGARCRDTRWWSGMLFAVDTSTKRTDPGLTDLGTRVVLLYFTRDELVELGTF